MTTLCDFCNEVYHTKHIYKYGSNFCTPECELCYMRKCNEINIYINQIFNRTYEEKP